jgi:hypothetical protein
MGLAEFVAAQEGYFADEGVDVEFDWRTFRGTQSSWKGMEYFQRPQDKPYAEGAEVVQSACEWGSICNASAGMGKFVPDCYGISPCAIFVRPDSKIRKPEDLADVEIAVGMRAGSHFSVPLHLEKHLPLDRIKTANVGGFGARLTALLDKEVEAASLLPPQIDMAKQLGLRPVLEGEFHTLWWVPGTAAKETVHGYLAALERAERAMDADLARYLPLWKLSVPAEFEDRSWDFSKFGRGERFVYEPFKKEWIDKVFAEVERWHLDQYMKDKAVENLVYTVPR